MKKNTTVLDIFGPFEIPFEVKGKAKRINDEHVELFWKKSRINAISQKQGCYIFGLRAASGFTPWYIGKTKRQFNKECFTDHKRRKYNELLWRGKRATPIMFFLALSGNKNKIPGSIINDIEKFLIQSAAQKNPNLLNVKVAKTFLRWGIKGIIRGGKGQATQKTKAFKTMMGL